LAGAFLTGAFFATFFTGAFLAGFFAALLTAFLTAFFIGFFGTPRTLCRLAREYQLRHEESCR
jgi:hypothetical protein